MNGQTISNFLRHYCKSFSKGREVKMIRYKTQNNLPKIKEMLLHVMSLYLAKLIFL